MPDSIIKNTDRRSFFKWSLLGIATLATTAGGVGSSLLGKDKDSLVTDLKDASTVVTDASLGVHFRLRTSGDFLLANPQNARDGQRIVWEFMQDAVGGHQISFDHKFKFGEDLSHVKLSTAPNKTDFLTAIYNQPAGKWHVVAFIRGY